MSHIVIAGPGRTGTSFIMRWLHRCGADTGAETSWHVGARAGFEQRFTPGGPRIQKDPWFFAYQGGVRPTDVERLVLPVRDLTDIAESRLRNEVKSIPRDHGHLLAEEVYGRAPGGMVYDLSIHHQESIAARMLYLPLEWALRHQIAVSLLHHWEIFDGPEKLTETFSEEITVDAVTAAGHWEILRGSTT